MNNKKRGRKTLKDQRDWEDRVIEDNVVSELDPETEGEH